MKTKYFIKLCFIFLLLIVGGFFIIPQFLPDGHKKIDMPLQHAARALASYSLEHDGFYPDTENWTNISYNIDEDKSINYIPGKERFYNGEFEITIIAWRQENGSVSYINSSPLVFSYAFNRNKGELPDYYYFYKNLSQEEKMAKLIERVKADNNEELEQRTGQSLLLLALLFGDDKTATSLILNDSQINKPDINKITPLMRAVSLQKYELIKLLLEHGADPKIINIFGDSAKDIAQKTNNSTIMNLFIKNH